MSTVPPDTAQSDESVGSTTPASFAAWGGLALIVAAGLILRLREAWQSMPDLVVNTLPDDAFYYFQIARNITDGNGASLDGETVTTGFHPLWLVIIMPFFSFSDRLEAVQEALTLGALLGAATIVLVYGIILTLTERWPAALLGAGFFALHPAIVMYGVNGLETSIAHATLALVCFLFVRMARKAPTEVTLGDFVFLGVSLGLMVLARTDSALVIPPVLGFFIVKGGPLRYRGALVSAICAGIGPALWLIWSMVATGSPVQDSAVAGGLLRRQAYLNGPEGDTWAFRIEKSWEITRETFFEKLPGQFMVPINKDVLPFWVAVLALAVLVALVPSRARGRTLASIGLIMVPFSGLFLVLLYSSAVRWFVRDWYYAPYALLAAILAGIVAAWVEGTALDVFRHLRGRISVGWPSGWRRISSSALVALGVYGVLSLALLRVYGPQQEGYVFRYGWQAAVLEATAYLRDETEPGTRIAAYNAGIPSYLSERTVVNLDGVVNRDAYEAARDCRTRDYIREMRIDIVADTRGQFLLAHCGLSFDEDLAELTSVGSPDPVYILIPKGVE